MEQQESRMASKIRKGPLEYLALRQDNRSPLCVECLPAFCLLLILLYSAYKVCIISVIRIQDEAMGFDQAFREKRLVVFTGRRESRYLYKRERY